MLGLFLSYQLKSGRHIFVLSCRVLGTNLKATEGVPGNIIDTMSHRCHVCIFYFHSFFPCLLPSFLPSPLDYISHIVKIYSTSSSLTQRLKVTLGSPFLPFPTAMDGCQTEEVLKFGTSQGAECKLPPLHRPRGRTG